MSVCWSEGAGGRAMEVAVELGPQAQVGADVEAAGHTIHDHRRDPRDEQPLNAAVLGARLERREEAAVEAAAVDELVACLRSLAGEDGIGEVVVLVARACGHPIRRQADHARTGAVGRTDGQPAAGPARQSGPRGGYRMLRLAEGTCSMATVTAVAAPTTLKLRPCDAQLRPPWRLRCITRSMSPESPSITFGSLFLPAQIARMAPLPVVSTVEVA